MHDVIPYDNWPEKAPTLSSKRRLRIPDQTAQLPFSKSERMFHVKHSVDEGAGFKVRIGVRVYRLRFLGLREEGLRASLAFSPRMRRASSRRSRNSTVSCLRA